MSLGNSRSSKIFPRPTGIKQVLWDIYLKLRLSWSAPPARLAIEAPVPRVLPKFEPLKEEPAQIHSTSNSVDVSPEFSQVEKEVLAMAQFIDDVIRADEEHKAKIIRNPPTMTLREDPFDLLERFPALTYSRLLSLDFAHIYPELLKPENSEAAKFFDPNTPIPYLRSVFDRTQVRLYRGFHPLFQFTKERYPNPKDLASLLKDLQLRYHPGRRPTEEPTSIASQLLISARSATSGIGEILNLPRARGVGAGKPHFSLASVTLRLTPSLILETWGAPAGSVKRDLVVFAPAILAILYMKGARGGPVAAAQELVGLIVDRSATTIEQTVARHAGRRFRGSFLVP